MNVPDFPPLASAAAARLRPGLDADEAIVHFIESTYGATDDAGLDAALSGDGGDRETLLELLLSPGPEDLAALEPALTPPLPPEAVDAAALELARLVPKIAVRFARTFAPRTLPLDADGARTYLLRLRPEIAVPDALREAAAAFPEPNVALAALRHARFQPSPRRDRFLAGLLERAADRADGLDLLRFSLGFLGRRPTEPSIYAALMEERDHDELLLEQAEEFELRRASSNFETMLAQGVRPPHFPVDELRRAVEDIDTVARLVFGRADPPTVRPDKLDLGSFDSDAASDVERLIRTLS